MRDFLGAQPGISGTVELIEAVLSTCPDNTGAILQETVDGEAVQALVIAVFLKGELLRDSLQNKELA